HAPLLARRGHSQARAHRDRLQQRPDGGACARGPGAVSGGRQAPRRRAAGTDRSGAGPLIWFLHVMRAFVVRELSAMAGYRLASVIRVVGVITAVGSLVFLSRFVGASANPHLESYGGNYLGFMVVGVLGAEFQQVGVSGLAQRI